MNIVLLDLNATLVENTYVHDLPYRYHVHLEDYRLWLVDRLKSNYVILMTARPEFYKDETICRITKLCGWQPNEAYFRPNNSRLPAPKAKEEMLENHVFPSHGQPDRTGKGYLAIESNAATRAMYCRYNIAAITQQQLRKGNYVI